MTTIKIIEQVKKYIKQKINKLSKVAQRNIYQLLVGIIKSGSTKLSNIARSINSGKDKLFHIIKRLSRNLKRKDIDIEELENIHIRQVGSKIRNDTLIAIDYGDIVKKYGKKFEKLAKVRDGSTGKIEDGYWTIEAKGIFSTGSIRSITNRIYSTKEVNFDSANTELLNVVEKIGSSSENRGIYIIDRAGDRIKIIRKLVEKGRKFIIRVNTGINSRNINIDGKIKQVKEAIKDIDLTEHLKLEKHTGEIIESDVGYKKISIPSIRDRVTIVVSKKRGGGYLVLLTNLRVDKPKDILKRVTQYLRRWSIEEMTRFEKSELDLEGFMVRKFESIKALGILVAIASDFVLSISQLGGWLIRRIKEISQPIFENRAVRFIYYRIFKGIQKLLYPYYCLVKP